ncbi:unnamed protein product [Tuber melanosporum]|uniref:(Perigord truffle) hypothetical protein n=1 Tax=Tuber melanosporum (strain Mel28) TaxID=656061 RepID=D5GAL8_TUBMM|nr:uncharacterized protein GSTUM_00003675001 [Tuber melanosporum]CAZ81561.1 unnamed protein product [Tuber melanosporum]
MALPSSGIYFFPEDDLPPPNDPCYNYLSPGQPPFVGAINVRNLEAAPVLNGRQPPANYPPPPVRQQVFLPLVQVSYQCQIYTTTARTTLTQTFHHPGNRQISKATYTFPLYANCSVVSFVCGIGESKIITGIVKPKEVAKQMYESAASSGQTAGLLEYNTPDVFTTSIGNIPAGVKVKVEIGYILELPHDAEVDGIRFTVPMSIAPRYGPPPPGAFGQNCPEVSVDKCLRMEIEVAMGEAIKSVQSPSHLTAVQLGKLGKEKEIVNDREHDPKKALVTLSQTPAELLEDFVLLITTITPHFISTPQALLETHPTISGHQALKVTLVPRFELPRTETPEKTEIIFLVDRSGSMRDTIGHVKSALRIFLKSLPLGCFFNIISFGSQYTFLWERSRAYTEGTLRIASDHIETFHANYGGTELLPPLVQACSRRHSEPGTRTEIMVLTDGAIWRLPELLEYIQQMRKQSGGAVRLFSIGVGERVSHALVQVIATAGGGYSQIVSSGDTSGGRLENGLEAKVVRMLNSALTDHVEEYKLHVLHEEGDEEDSQNEDEEEGVCPREQVTPAHTALVQVRPPQGQSRRINLFDPTAAPRRRSPTPPPSTDVNLASTLRDGGGSGNRFTHLKKLQGPEVLQAPFEIPPLFPYERSVVYLLIPPTTRQLKYAKSVTLSATTIAGDKLSLSIPITRIEQPGKTVHQLAARMLLRDLEEGRSWLHSEKYCVTAGDATGVQEYIQREGEEVGMRWSLVSKWTSFVGIEEEVLNVAPIPTPASLERGPSELSEGRSSASGSSRSPETSADLDTSTPCRPDRIPPSRPDSTHSLPTAIGSKALWGVVAGAQEANNGVDTMNCLLEPRDTPDPTHPVWNRPILHSDWSPPHDRPTLQPTLDSPRRSSGTGYHGTVPTSYGGATTIHNSYNTPLTITRSCHAITPPPPPPLPRPRSPSSLLSSNQSAAVTGASAPKLAESSQPITPPTRHGSSAIPNLNGFEFGAFTSKNMVASSAGPLTNIHRLIAAQKFDGSFHVADEYVVELLGSRMSPIPEQCGGDKVAWVALLIAVFLERKYSHLRDVWELVVRKIWVFLSGREGVKVEEVKVVAEELVSKWE